MIVQRVFLARNMALLFRDIFKSLNDEYGVSVSNDNDSVTEESHFG